MTTWGAGSRGRKRAESLGAAGLFGGPGVDSKSTHPSTLHPHLEQSAAADSASNWDRAQPTANWPRRWTHRTRKRCAAASLRHRTPQARRAQVWRISGADRRRDRRPALGLARYFGHRCLEGPPGHGALARAGRLLRRSAFAGSEQALALLVRDTGTLHSCRVTSALGPAARSGAAQRGRDRSRTAAGATWRAPAPAGRGRRWPSW